MEADSTSSSSSSLQQKEIDDKSVNEGSQISTSNQDNLSKIEEPQATQRKVHEEGEKDVHQTLRSDDQDVSKVAELTGEDSQREDDISKEQETRSYESVHSDENLKEDITKAIPGKVTSVDNLFKDKVSEEAREMSKVESTGVNEMEGNDNIERKAENEPGSIDQVSYSSVPDVSGPSQTRQVEGAVSSSCSFEGTKKSGVDSLLEVGVDFGKDVASSIQTENTLKKNIEDKTDGISPTSITKDVKDDSLPSESTSATSKSNQVVNDSQGAEQEEPHLALPDKDREVREQFQEPTDDRVLLQDTDKDKEASITERSESENPTVESQQEHEAMSVADEVEDEEDSTKGAEPQVTPSSDSRAVGDVSVDDATEMVVTDTGTRDANKVQENEKMDTTGGESKQEDAEGHEKECEGKKNAEEKEGEDNQINQEEDTEGREEQIEPESTSEQKEAITAAGDEEDGSKDNGQEGETDQTGEGEEEKLADEKEGETDGKGEDDGDEDEKEEEAEGKSERRRTSPIRCFDESSFTVEKLFEYQWPQDHGEFFFVQEQISEYLGVTSFKRKYPALERRLIAVEERRFLKDKGVVTEEQVTLGLTALKADEVYDVMQKDFPDKYSDYARLIQQRQREAVKNQHKEYGTPAVDSAKMKNYIKKAVRQAAEYNASLMREKREERQYYLDLQTMLVHCPNTKMKKLTKEQSKPGPYPVAVIPGQFQNYYKSYTPEELKYLPVNTAIYGPMATQKQSDIAPSVPPGSEVSSDDEDLSLATIEPPFDHERITPGFFKDQMQSVLPTPPRETPMISLQPAPMVSLAPPPPVTQVLSQLLQQKAIIPPKHIQYVPKDIPDAICGLCLKDRDGNRKGEPEELVHCSQCDNSGHPSCLEMSAALVCAIKTYPWQCMECKTCTLCGDPTHEDKMMFCDECDRGYHTFCVGLTELPTGLWACASCRCVPPARPLPPPPIEVMPAPLNGTPEAVTPAPQASVDPDTPTNGLKRPAEPLPTGEEKEEAVMTEIKTERTQAPTPPPAKKRHTKKNKATPAKS